MSATQTATMGSALTGTIEAGTYCVALYDVGSMTAALDYTITVTHH